jgi:intracellular septation protein A
MVRETLEAAAERDEGGLTEPTFRGVLLTGLPGFLREGFLPVGAFYGGLRLSGLAAGIAASTAVCVLIYLYERRAGRDGLLVRVSLAFVLVQGAIGLAAHSATVYLAQPVLANAAWGIAFLISAVIRRPLAGALACAWYPFPQWLRESEPFKRVFGIQSLVWGAYFVVRSAVRLAVLLNGGLESFLVTVLLTGTPMMLLLIAWSIRHAIRGLAETEPPDLTPSGREATLAGEHTFVTLPDPGDADADRPTAGDLELPHGLRRRTRVPAHGS